MTPVVSSPALDQRGTGALARKVGPAIVRLDVVSGDGARSSVSGVVFRDDGLILTSALPLRGATTITAVLSDGRQLDASVRGLDDATDVAVVEDRKGVVSGKGVSVRVDLGGRRSIKKEKTRVSTADDTNRKRTE